MTKQYYVYIMSNETNTVTYTAVTNDLLNSVNQHKNELVKSFTSRYKVHKLVYFEVGESIESCILREKQIKSRSRAYKIKLINEMNPNWHDLSKDLMES